MVSNVAWQQLKHLWAPLWATNWKREVNHAKTYFCSLWWRSWRSGRPGWKWKKLAGHLCPWLSGFLIPEKKYKNLLYLTHWPCLNVTQANGVMHSAPSAANEVSTSQDRHLNIHKSGFVKVSHNYRASDVALAEEDVVRDQLRFVIIDVFNCNVDFHKRLQTYKNTAGRR